MANYVSIPVYREQATGKFRVTGAANVATVLEYDAIAADVATAFNLVRQQMLDAGINPASGETLTDQEKTYATDPYIEAGTGKIRVKAASHFAATATAGSANFTTLRASVNLMLAQLNGAGINPASSESAALAVQAAQYPGGVYLEQGTGKVRVKAAVNIADVAASPTDVDVCAVALNDIIDLLNDLGINPDA